MQATDQFQFPIVSPSLIAADWMNMGQEIRTCMELGLPWLHCDVMDGHFVPNLTLGPGFIKSIKKKFPSSVCDVHLMVSSPTHWIHKFMDAGASVITVHIENCEEQDIVQWSQRCESAGVIFGLSLRPTTPVIVLKPWLRFIKLVNVMSVYPGFYGQKFIEGSEERIAEIRALFPRESGWIKVDGGINEDTGRRCITAGADILVAGGAFFGAKDRKGWVKHLTQP